MLIRGERGRPDRRVWRLAKHIPCSSFPAGAERETHPAATERSEQHKTGPLSGLVALPKHQDMREISETIVEINDLHKRILEHQELEQQHMNGARSMRNIQKNHENQRLA